MISIQILIIAIQHNSCMTFEFKIEMRHEEHLIMFKYNIQHIFSCRIQRKDWKY